MKRPQQPTYEYGWQYGDKPNYGSDYESALEEYTKDLEEYCNLLETMRSRNHMDRLRIQRIDNITRILVWNDKEKGWDIDSIIVGDFDMEFAGSLQEIVTLGELELDEVAADLVDGIELDELVDELDEKEGENGT